MNELIQPQLDDLQKKERILQQEQAVVARERHSISEPSRVFCLGHVCLGQSSCFIWEDLEKLLYGRSLYDCGSKPVILAD